MIGKTKDLLAIPVHFRWIQRNGPQSYLSRCVFFCFFLVLVLVCRSRFCSGFAVTGPASTTVVISPLTVVLCCVSVTVGRCCCCSHLRVMPYLRVQIHYGHSVQWGAHEKLPPEEPYIYIIMTREPLVRRISDFIFQKEQRKVCSQPM